VKKAINQWCFPAEWTWDRVFALCREQRFDGVELCVDYRPFLDAIKATPQHGLIAEIAKSVGSTLEASKSLSFDSSTEDMRRVADLAGSHGVEVTSLLTIAQFHFSLISEDENSRQTGIDLVRRLLDIAVLVGAPKLLIVPGVLTDTMDYAAAIHRLEESLRILASEAEDRNVGLGLENVWGKLLYSPVEFLRIIEDVNSQFVGVHFDVGNVMQYGHPDQWIHILGDHLLNVHLKDFLQDINNIRGFTHLFQGDVPWGRVMQALREVGYSGYLIAEVPPYPYCPEEGIRDISRKIDILLEA
jgi:L-ribulose-5-phosphate 3-epimerase